MVKETVQQATAPPVDYLLFYVNGKQVIEHHAEPDWTLLWYLRNSQCFCSSAIIDLEFPSTVVSCF